MALIDKEAAKNDPQHCPAKVDIGWRSRLCGKPVKRQVDSVGLCGVHAAGAERSKATDERRQQEWDARNETMAKDRAAMDRLRELGVRYWDKQEVLRVLEEIHTHVGDSP